LIDISIGEQGERNDIFDINTDWVNANFDIYAQRFSKEGMPINGNFRVNDDQDSVRQDYPAVATSNSGKFIIAWEDGSR
jgi:hypothetical protein